MRRGITPVVAVVLLMMMTVAAAGGSYAWMTQVQGEAQEDAAQGLSTGVDLRDVRCRGINISFTASNTGDTALSSDEADVYVRADGDLLGAGTADVDGAAFLQPGGVGSSHVTLPETTRRNVRYEVEVVFDDDDHATTAFCRSQGTMVGEAHRVDVSGTSWTTVDFLTGHSDPVVLATTNTVDTGNHPLIPQTRNVDNGSAEVRLCEHEAADGCADFGTETMGVVVVDAADLDDVDGAAAGTTTIGSSGGESGTSVSFTEQFDGTPVVFANAVAAPTDTDVPVWVTGKDRDGFTATRCNHTESTDDDCGPYSADLDIGWLAVDPGNNPFTALAANDTADKHGSWVTVSYPERDGPVVGLAAIQGNDGGQDPKVNEARNAGTASMDVRFCEHDYDDDCDGHASNVMAWLAATEGMILR